MNFQLMFENALRKALGGGSIAEKSEFYGIGAGVINTSVNVYNTTWVALTGLQVSHPAKKNAIHNFLDKHCGYLTNEDKKMSDWDMKYYEKYLEELNELING